MAWPLGHTGCALYEIPVLKYLKGIKGGKQDQTCWYRTLQSMIPYVSLVSLRCLIFRSQVCREYWSGIGGIRIGAHRFGGERELQDLIQQPLTSAVLTCVPFKMDFHIALKNKHSTINLQPTKASCSWSSCGQLGLANMARSLDSFKYESSTSASHVSRLRWTLCKNLRISI